MKTNNLLLVVFFSFCCVGNAIASLNDGMVAHYAFDGSPNNSSDSRYNGTEYGGISYSSGKFGQAINFDGNSSEYVQAHPNPLSGTGNGDFTISVWTKTSKTTDNWIYFFGENLVGGEEGIRTLINNKGQVVVQITDLTRGSSNSSSITSSTTLSNHSWHNIVIVRHNSSLALFINGKYSSSILSSQSLKSNEFSNSITVGVRSTNWNYPFHGQIDDLKIYNRALPSSEVQLLYQDEPQVNSDSNANFAEFFPTTGKFFVPSIILPGDYSKVFWADLTVDIAQGSCTLNAAGENETDDVGDTTFVSNNSDFNVADYIKFRGDMCITNENGELEGYSIVDIGAVNFDSYGYYFNFKSSPDDFTWVSPMPESNHHHRLDGQNAFMGVVGSVLGSIEGTIISLRDLLLFFVNEVTDEFHLWPFTPYEGVNVSNRVTQMIRVKDFNQDGTISLLVELYDGNPNSNGTLKSSVNHVICGK